MAMVRHGGDYSFARPRPEDLVAAGWSFVIRYASRVDGGKNLTPAEALALSRVDLKIATVWENVASDRDPLKGYQQGVADAIEHHRQVAACGGPPDAVLYYAVDWNASPDQFPAIADYFAGCVAAGGSPSFVGCYGHTYLLTYLFDRGVIGHGWIPQATSWSAGHDEPRAKLRQTGAATIGGSQVDLDEADIDIGWRLDVTFAPADLLAVQRYAQAKTGQDLNSLGIVGDAAHASSGGYHVGNDLLKLADRCPGPACSLADYSYADARAVSTDGLGRDLAAPDRLAGDDDAASAFDMGGGFDRFLTFNAWMRARLLANDPRTRDIREMIYTLDGQTVRRIDRTGRQPDSGDSSHLSHTHFSFYRDSLGRRDQDDNFMGLLKEFFGDSIGEDDEQMSTGDVPAGFAFGNGPRDDLLVTGLGMGPVNQPPGTGFGNKRCVLGLSTDFAPAGGVQLRLAVKANGAGWNVQMVTVKSADDRWYMYLPDGCTKISVGRVKREAGDVDLNADGTVKASAETCPVWWDLEFEKR